MPCIVNCVVWHSQREIHLLRLNGISFLCETVNRYVYAFSSPFLPFECEIKQIFVPMCVKLNFLDVVDQPFKADIGKKCVTCGLTQFRFCNTF